MTLTERDRKIIMMLVPLAIVAAYWFLLLAPKREESTVVQDELTQVEGERDTAVSKLAQLTKAKDSFADDYATVIYLGKAVPASVDMPSLLVQLDRAARGTGINFTGVETGDRTEAPSSSSNTSGGSGSSDAQSGPGKAADTAQDGANTASNDASRAANSDASSSGSSPAGGASDAGAGGTTPTSAGAPGLESIPLDFTFHGSFFGLADFFHRMKRFVRVANDKIIVRGRLMTIDSFSFDSKDTFPSIETVVHATVYLAPKAEGVSAGATPQGPAGAPPQAPGQTASSSPTPTPAAAVTAP